MLPQDGQIAGAPVPSEGPVFITGSAPVFCRLRELSTRLQSAMLTGNQGIGDLPVRRGDYRPNVSGGKSS
jgi:hypothetical protein